MRDDIAAQQLVPAVVVEDVTVVPLDPKKPRIMTAPCSTGLDERENHDMVHSGASAHRRIEARSSLTLVSIKRQEPTNHTNRGYRKCKLKREKIIVNNPSVYVGKFVDSQSLAHHQAKDWPR